MSLAGLQSSWSPATQGGGIGVPINSISGGTAPNTGSVTVDPDTGGVNVVSETASVIFQIPLGGALVVSPTSDTPSGALGVVTYAAGIYSAAISYSEGAIVQFTDNNYYYARAAVPVGAPGPTAPGTEFVLFSTTTGSTPAAISEGAAPTLSSVTCAGGNITTAASGTLTATSAGAATLSSSAAGVTVSGAGVAVTSSSTLSLTSAGAFSISDTVGNMTISATATGAVITVVCGNGTGTTSYFSMTTSTTPPAAGTGLVITPLHVYANGTQLGP
jgi:hypothetical protein